VHELYSTGFLLFNIWYSLILPLIFNKQTKNHSKVCFVGYPLIFISISTLRDFWKDFLSFIFLQYSIYLPGFSYGITGKVAKYVGN